jgi:hypothetical protein
MASEPKTDSFLMRMAPTETRMLLELSEKVGLNKSDVIRQLVRREHAKIIGDKPRAKKPKR